MKKLIFIISILSVLNSPVRSQSGWNEQTLPVSGTISDMQFINAQTGWITLYNPTNLIKTTNSGKNWTVLQSGTNQFASFEFLNDTLGYATGYTGANGLVSKTTNGGINWSILYNGSNYFANLSFINNDTGYFCGSDGNFAGIWKTTNGAANITRIYTTNFTTITQISFLKQNYNNEYYGWWLSGGFMSKTTNSGLNWSVPISSINGISGNYNSLFYLNKDTGWVGFDPNVGNYKIYRTDNSGEYWTEQSDNTSGIPDIYFDNNENGWAGYRPFKLLATSSGGLNWGTQPSQIFNNLILSIVDSLIGWCGLTRLTHTTDGGGLITYVGIDPLNTEIPVSFNLKQNYPNPFNPQTTIEFSILKQSSITITLFDITGKEVLKVYDNESLIPGNYKVSLDFSRRSLSSGVYFYTINANDKNNGQLFNETKKMIFLK